MSCIVRSGRQSLNCLLKCFYLNKKNTFSVNYGKLCWHDQH